MRSATLQLLLLAQILPAAGPAWTVSHAGADVTGEAGLRETAGALLVDLSALAPRLGLTLRQDGAGILISRGADPAWRATDGDTVLSGVAGQVSLAAAVEIRGGRLLVPVEALGILANIEVDVEPQQRRVRLGPDSSARPAGPEGWESVKIDKTAKELVYTARMNGVPLRAGPGKALSTGSSALRQPEQSGNLRVQTTQHYIPGADAATELNGAGTLFGYKAAFNTLVTEGARGLGMIGGRIAFTGGDGRWEAQAGDLFSPLWGFGRGLRYGQRIGQRHRVATALYLQTRPGEAIRPLLGFSDDFDLTSNLRLQAEATSDGSYFARGTLHGARLNADVFHRDARRGMGSSQGAFASYTLPRSILVSARWSLFGEGPGRLETRGLAARVPLFRRSHLSLESSRMRGPLRRSSRDSAALSMPIRKLRLRLMYSSLEDTLLETGSLLPRASSRLAEMSGWATYLVNPRLSFDVQYTLRRQPGGGAQDWSQLLVHYRPSRNWEISWMGSIDDPLDVKRMRSRLQWLARPSLYLSVEFGNIPTFQNYTYHLPDAGWKIAIRKDWNIHTPLPGGEVRGVVRDSSGRPMPGAVVEVGEYAAEADERGEYRLRRLPKGKYEAKVRDNSVPAGSYASNEARLFEAGPRRHAWFDFDLAPLGSIRGTVYIDADNDQLRGAGEEVTMVAVQLGQSATSTSDKGEFKFDNLRPGRHTVRLDPALLPKDLELDSPGSIELLLNSSKPVAQVEFRLRRRVKPIVMQEEGV